MSLFDAVIFDMDGLLVDSETVWFEAEKEVFRRRGVDFTHEVRASIVGLRVDAFLDRLRIHYGLPDTTQTLVDELNAAMLELIPGHVFPRPGAYEILDYVRELGMPVAMASNSPMVIIDATIHAMDWDALFPVRCSGDDEVEGKPAPHVYLTAARRLGVEPAACVGLEDSPTGARAVVAAGMTCYAVPDFSHTTRERFADITPHVFDTLHDVIAQMRNGRRV